MPSPTPADPSPNSAAHLLNGETTTRYRHTLVDGVERVAERLARTERPFTGITPDQLAGEIDAIDLDEPLGDASAALDEMDRVYLRDAVYFHHPRYLAHLNCPVVIPAVLAEAVLSAVNSSLDTWDQSAGGTLIERRLVEWTAGRLGLGPDADGIFTSGGSQSNLQAMLLARDEACRLARCDAATPQDTTAMLPRLRILTSEVSHFSIVKAAALLGLAADAVVSVPCDRDKRMQTSALAFELERCQQEGLVVMAVAATAGTTDFGSIDPLPEIADLCAAHGVWLHVDGAYGCGLLASRRRRHLLDGVERADSVTVDYHKAFFQPVSSSAVLVRHRDVLRHVTHHADYLNPARLAAERIPNQVEKSLQTTRRFDALKLWLTLRVMGADAVGELFDDVIDRAAEAWQVLDDDPRFEVVTKPRLSTLVFRFVAAPGVPAGLVDRANLHARDALSRSGAAVIGGTVVDGHHHLKFTLLNPMTSLDDIRDVLDLVAEHAHDYLSEHSDLAFDAVHAG